MDKKDSICFSFKRMNRTVERGIHSCLAQAGFDEVTNMHGWILGFIDRQSEPVYQRDIEAHFGIGRSSVTNILQLMEKKGYLTRTTSKKDARLKRIELTELGRRIHRETVETIDSAHDRMEAGITDEERRIAFEVMEKIRKNVEDICASSSKSSAKNQQESVEEA